MTTLTVTSSDPIDLTDSASATAAPKPVATGTAADPVPEVGSSVEVLCSFTRDWTPGFTVDSVTKEGVWLRRSSDGQVLPSMFAFSAVRRATRRPNRSALARRA